MGIMPETLNCWKFKACGMQNASCGAGVSVYGEYQKTKCRKCIILDLKLSKNERICNFYFKTIELFYSICYTKCRC